MYSNVKRIPILVAAGSLLATSLVVVTPLTAYSQAGVELLKVDISVVAKGYRVSKLAGTTVVNDKGENIGKVDDIVLGPDNRAMFAVINVGGFLGLNKHLVAVPYQSLNVKDGGTKIVLPGASREELKKLAEFKYAA
jgi:sporulation protein YlmC with PRC-barrel domain